MGLRLLSSARAPGVKEKEKKRRSKGLGASTGLLNHRRALRGRLASLGGADKSLSVLGDKILVDVRENTTASDGCPDQKVELLVAADGELQVARGDTLHTEILGGVA
jgi:hypothetical protein